MNGRGGSDPGPTPLQKLVAAFLALIAAADSEDPDTRAAFLDIVIVRIASEVAGRTDEGDRQ